MTGLIKFGRRMSGGNEPFTEYVTKTNRGPASATPAWIVASLWPCSGGVCAALDSALRKVADWKRFVPTWPPPMPASPAPSPRTAGQRSNCRVASAGRRLGKRKGNVGQRPKA